MFRLTGTQWRIATVLLPPCLVLATGTMFLVVAVGMLNQNNFIQNAISMSQESMLILLACIASAVAFIEFFYFLWVRFSSHSLLSEDDRHSLRYALLCRKLSLMAYTAYLFSILTLLFGLFIIPGAIVDIHNNISGGATINMIFGVQLGIGIIFLLTFLIKRLFYLK